VRDAFAHLISRGSTFISIEMTAQAIDAASPEAEVNRCRNKFFALWITVSSVGGYRLAYAWINRAFCAE
jgi:hypothetical protein